MPAECRAACSFRREPMRPNSSTVVIECKPSIRFVFSVICAVQFGHQRERCLCRRMARLLGNTDPQGQVARPIPSRRSSHRTGTTSVATSSRSTMDNQTRSEISRKRAIDAAFTILARDGVGGLTFDSLSRESGISKGGLLHQFRTRQGVLCALLQHQKEQFEQIARDYMATEGASKAEPNLAAQIAIYRESINQPNSVARAVLAALVENPNLLDEMKMSDVQKMKTLQDEATDFDLSLLRYFAASGLAFHTLLGLSPLDDSARNRLFERLLDEGSWQAEHAQTKRRKRSVG